MRLTHLVHRDFVGVVAATTTQVGKTTLVRSLIRRYTKTTMTDIQGPVTVVTGKARRLTVIECPNDLGAMIDIGKVADLVLLMVDGSFGLEMVSSSPAHGERHV